MGVLSRILGDTSCASNIEVYGDDVRDPVQQEALQRLSTLPERR